MTKLPRISAFPYLLLECLLVCRPMVKPQKHNAWHCFSNSTAKIARTNMPWLIAVDVLEQARHNSCLEPGLAAIPQRENLNHRSRLWHRSQLLRRYSACFFHPIRAIRCCLRITIHPKLTENHMHYKTIVLELLQEQYPILYRLLRQEGTLRISLEEYATQLRNSHLDWKETLTQTRPGSSETQIASEAIELALNDLQATLPPAYPQDEDKTLSLDGAMAFILRRRTRLA